MGWLGLPLDGNDVASVKKAQNEDQEPGIYRQQQHYCGQQTFIFHCMPPVTTHLYMFLVYISFISLGLSALPSNVPDYSIQHGNR